MRRPARTAVMLAGLLGCAACKRDREAPPGPPLAPGEVPRITAPITVDGELHERDWNQRARVAVFADRGAEARPYSQIRLLRDQRTLFVGLYAADQDIRSTDAFELMIGTLAIAIDPRGRIMPALAGAQAAAAVDETLDDPRDEDEEWVIEAAIPIAAIPPETTTIRAVRCDTPKDGKRRCGAWDGPLALSSAGSPPR